MSQSYVEILKSLGQRQRQVLYWRCQGKTRKQIAAKIGVQEATVKYHLQLIYLAFDLVGEPEAKRNWLIFRPIRKELLKAMSNPPEDFSPSFAVKPTISLPPLLPAGTLSERFEDEANSSQEFVPVGFALDEPTPEELAKAGDQVDADEARLEEALHDPTQPLAGLLPPSTDSDEGGTQPVVIDPPPTRSGANWLKNVVIVLLLVAIAYLLLIRPQPDPSGQPGPVSQQGPPGVVTSPLSAPTLTTNPILTTVPQAQASATSMALQAAAAEATKQSVEATVNPILTTAPQTQASATSLALQVAAKQTIAATVNPILTTVAQAQATALALQGASAEATRQTADAAVPTPSPPPPLNVTPQTGTLQFGESFSGRNMTLTAKAPSPCANGWPCMAVDFTVENRTGGTINFDGQIKGFFLDFGTTERFIADGSVAFNDFGDRSSKDFRVTFPITSDEFNNFLRKDDVKYVEVVAEGFDPRVPKATWRQQVLH